MNLIFQFQKEDYITIEIEKDVKSDEKIKSKSDNTLKCDNVPKIDSVSNSSTSETLIDIQINPSDSSELNKIEIDAIDDEMRDNSVIKEDENTENVNICITSTDTSPQEEAVAKGAIPSIKSENFEIFSDNNKSKRTIPSISEEVKIDISNASPTGENRASDTFDGVLKTTSAGNKLMRAQTLSCSRDASPSRYRIQ